MSPQPFTLLFLCTANSARSILAEAVLNAAAAGRMRAFSAGSQPRGEVNPDALRCLERAGYALDGLASKSWDRFTGPDAPTIDAAITLCDSAAAESCPLFPGGGLRAHWGLPDPAAVAGDDARRQAAFADTLQRVRARVDRLLALPVETMTAESLKRELVMIGRHTD